MLGFFPGTGALALACRYFPPHAGCTGVLGLGSRCFLGETRPGGALSSQASGVVHLTHTGLCSWSHCAVVALVFTVLFLLCFVLLFVSVWSRPCCFVCLGMSSLFVSVSHPCTTLHGSLSFMHSLSRKASTGNLEATFFPLRFCRDRTLSDLIWSHSLGWHTF